jgi:hypothetical protein
VAQPLPTSKAELDEMAEHYRKKILDMMKCKPRQLRVAGTTTLFEIDGSLYVFDRDTRMSHTRDVTRIVANSNVTNVKTVHKLAPLYAGHRVLVNGDGDVRTSCNTYMHFPRTALFVNTFALSVDEEFDCINCEAHGVPEGWLVIPRIILHRNA